MSYIKMQSNKNNTEKFIKIKKFYRNSIRKKIYLYISKIKYYLKHENTNILRKKIYISLIRFVGMSIFAFFLLLVLKLVGYQMTIMNFLSAFALLMLIEEVPAFIKRCRR